MNERFYKIFYVTLLGLLTAFGPVCSDIYLPALPEITAYFKSDPSYMQLSLTSCFIGIAAGQFMMGPISDSLGRKLPLLFSLLLFALASWLCARCTSVGMLIVIRFFQGLAGGAGIVIAKAMACDVFSGHELTRFISVLMSINASAPVVAPFIGAGLITFLPWPWLFYAMGLWGLVMFVCSCSPTLVPETLKQRAEGNAIKSALRDFASGLGSMRFFLMVMVYACLNMGFFGYLADSPFIFQGVYGFSPAGYSVIFSVFSLTIALCSLAGGRLSERIGEVQVVIYSLLVMFVCSCGVLAVALLNPVSPVYALVLLLVYGGASGASFTAGFTLAITLRTAGTGAASGFFGVMTYMFGACAMPLMGLMGELSFVPLGIDLVLSTIVAAVLFRISASMGEPLEVLIEQKSISGDA